MSFLVGTVVRLDYTVQVSGTLTDPTGITLTVEDPAGVTTPYTPVHDSTGTYHFDYVPSLVGEHIARWVTTGTAAAADEQAFTVRGAYSTVLTLADVRAHLNIPASDSSHDSELQGFLDGALAALAYATGPISPTTYTEVRNGGSPVIMLDNPPVISITSVTEYVGTQSYNLTAQPLGATVDNYGYSLDDPTSGKLVRRGSSGMPQAFYGGHQSVVITYLAGLRTIPADLRLAILEDIRGLYQQTQQGGRVGGGQIGAGGDDQWTVGPMRLFPRLSMLLDGPSRTPSIG